MSRTLKYDGGVDKLAIVFNVNPFYHQAIINFFHKFSFREHPHNIYRLNLAICPGDLFEDVPRDENFHVFLAPYNPKLNFLKIEYNPNKLPTSTVLRFWDMMCNDTSMFLFFGDGIINRIDYNIDIKDKDINVEMLYHFLSSNARLNHIVTRNGSMETFYLGSMSSDSFIRIYDKFKESKDEAHKGIVRIEKQCNNLNLSLVDFIKQFPEVYDFKIKFFEPVKKNCSTCDYFSFVQYCLKYVSRNLNKTYNKFFLERDQVIAKILVR